jgi:Rieske 2Fe-2S family protein
MSRLHPDHDLAPATPGGPREAHAQARAGWRPPATLPGRDYSSDDVFRLECERLFHGGWFCVGREEDVGTGAFAVAEVAGESVLLVRDEQGALRGFLNVCRHRGSRLCEGSGPAGKALRCPYHAWSYSLDGRLLATPNVALDESLPRERLGLWHVALDCWEGFVWVSLADDPAPLDEHLHRWASDDPFQWGRYDVGGLRVGARREYEVAANWKILVENYNECLHCPTVHPELVRIVPLYRHGEVEDAPDMNGNGNSLASGMTSFTPTGRSSLPPLPGISEDDRHTFYGVTLLPNLIVNYHSDCVSTFLLLPHGPGSTRVVCHYLFAPETVAAAGFDPSEVVEFRHRLAQQDWAVCERAQLSMASRAYAGGGILPYADRFVHAFHRQYLAMRDEGSA